MIETRLIGLVGGLSWESSAVYYRLINQGVRDRLGSPHSARILLWSFDFQEIELLQHANDWAALHNLMKAATQRLAAAGADYLFICSNTMHRMFDGLENESRVPFIHIADPTAEAVLAAGYQRVALLGTKFTMEAEFYRERLERRGIVVLTPNEPERNLVHRVIYEELVAGEISDNSRAALRNIIAEMAAAGAEAVVLGCTELMLLVTPVDSCLPLIDTTSLHAAAAVDAALGKLRVTA